MGKDYSHLRENPIEEGRFQPALAFEQLNNISGISENYTFPCARDADAYDEYRDLTGLFFAEASAENLWWVFAEWERLKDLNPALEKLDLRNMSEIQHAIFGVTSLFNIEDIQFFVDHWREGPLVAHRVNSEMDYMDLKREALAKAQWPHIQWVPAPQTLEKIRDQLSPPEPQ